MIIATPTDTPVMIPDVSRVVATVGLLLLHVPPMVISANTVLEPMQVLSLPTIGAGVALIDTIVVAKPQPVT